MKYFQKVKKVINHPGNNPLHFPAIKKLIEIYREKTGDIEGYMELLFEQDEKEKEN